MSSRRGGPQHIPRPPVVEEGRPAPWVDLGPLNPTAVEVRDAFSGLGPALRSGREALATRGSAVLAPLYEHDGDLRVVLTRRSSNLRVHSGEVSFPGGRSEPDETLEETARREAREEIGLDPSGVEIIGELDHLTTITSGSFIVPYVGLLPGGRSSPTRPRSTPSSTSACRSCCYPRCTARNGGTSSGRSTRSSSSSSTGTRCGEPPQPCSVNSWGLRPAP